MFGAFGGRINRELMLVNLDLLDITDAGQFPSQKLIFILFNPPRLPPDSRGSRFRRRERANRALDCQWQAWAMRVLQIAKRAFCTVVAEF